jgi:hypothetical protein
MNLTVTIYGDKITRSNLESEIAALLQQATDKVAQHGIGEYSLYTDAGNLAGKVAFGLPYGRDRVEHLLKTMHSKHRSFGEIKVINHVKGVVTAIIQYRGKRQLHDYPFRVENDVLRYRGVKEEV